MAHHAFVEAVANYGAEVPITPAGLQSSALLSKRMRGARQVGGTAVFPDRKPVEIRSVVISNRQSVVAIANVKSQQAAPVYVNVYVAAAFVRQPRSGLPYIRYLLLVLQYGSDADAHGRRSSAKSAIHQDGSRLVAVHELW